MSIKYSRLDFSKNNKIRHIATVHENVPSEWGDRHRVSEAEIRHRIEFLKNKIQSADFYLGIAETDSEELIGFHWIEIEAKNKARFGHIGSLWVSKEYRKLGIARMLKANAEVWAKRNHAEYLLTEVFFDNKKMIEYNKKLGFMAKQVIMKKDLK